MNITADLTARFEHILALEAGARSAKAAEAFRGCGVSPYGMEQQATKATAATERLYAAIAALTPDEARLYGEYRAEAQRPTRPTSDRR